MNAYEKLSELSEKVKALDDFVVVHHYDADGCSAGAIMFKALSRLGKSVKKIWIKQLYKETINEIKGLGKNYVFVDFGSGQLSYLKEEFGENLFVFDHHERTNVQHPNHFSPFDYGINGGNEISASGISYLFAETLDKKNIDLIQLAIVGAVGDVQDFKGKLIGLNSELAKKGVNAGIVKIENDLKLYGRITRPLIQFLEFSTSPIIPEITANQENARKFLQENGIELKDGDRWRTYSDLSFEEKKELATALILHLQKHNLPEWKISELFGEVYLFPSEDKKSPLYEAKEFSTLCNACGRHGMADIAIEVCLGDRGSNYSMAIDLMAEHRRQLREGIDFVAKNGISEEKEFYWFDAGEKISESIIGIVAGMLYGSGIIETRKPIIAIAHNKDGYLKISGRATNELVGMGLNLGIAFRKSCEKLGEGNEGGGHAIAAGLKIKKEKLNEFLQNLNEIISEQYTKS